MFFLVVTMTDSMNGK